MSSGVARRSAGAAVGPPSVRPRPIGPPPSPDAPGQPLRPWTIPNLVGYLRLAALPLFLYLAFDSGDGRSAPAAILFWLIAAGDYLDGFLARATGQYSRMGALLDPLVDRLTILSGAAVCWHFDLLPRWALAVLAAREVVTLVLAQIGAAARGRSSRSTGSGRIAVFAIMGAIFLAMVFDGWVPEHPADRRARLRDALDGPLRFAPGSGRRGSCKRPQAA